MTAVAPLPAPTARAMMRVARTTSVAVCEVRLPPNFRVPTHDHGPPHIAVVIAGAIREHSAKSYEDYTAGWMRYSPAEDVHVVESLDVGARVIVIEGFGFPQLQLNQRIRIGPDRAGPLTEQLCEQLFESPFGSPAAVEESALALFTMVRRVASRDDVSAPARLERVRARLADLESARDGMDDLAALAGCHRTFLARAFRAWYGVSIGEYRRRCRLQATWRLLADVRVPLGAVATHGGFADQSHMTRVFRREVGDTPANVRTRLLSSQHASWFTAHPLETP